jgi:hypothetical protein
MNGIRNNSTTDKFGVEGLVTALVYLSIAATGKSGDKSPHSKFDFTTVFSLKACSPLKVI